MNLQTRVIWFNFVKQLSEDGKSTAPLSRGMSTDTSYEKTKKQTNKSFADFRLFAKPFILTVAARTALRNSSFNNIIWTNKIAIRACKSESAKNVLEWHDIKGFVLRKSRARFRGSLLASTIFKTYTVGTGSV